MPTPSNKNPEVKKAKKTAKESVDSLIGKKKSEKESKTSESASAKMESTQGEVADVMAGAEKPSEKISEKGEKKGENKGGGAAATTGDDDDDDQIASIKIEDYKFPSETVMIKKIRVAINAQVKAEWKNAKKFEGKLTSGGAEGYNKTIAKIRELKHVLASLLISTFGAVKSIYIKYFQPNGKRRKLKDVG